MSLCLIIEIKNYDLFGLEIKRDYKSSRLKDFYYGKWSFVYHFKIHVFKDKIEEISKSLAHFEMINKFYDDELCIGNNLIKNVCCLDAIIVDGLMLKHPYIEEIKMVKPNKETENEFDGCDIGVISGTFSEKRWMFSKSLGDVYFREF